jgi:hypothetical protein
MVDRQSWVDAANGICSIANKLIIMATTHCEGRLYLVFCNDDSAVDEKERCVMKM